MVNIISSDDVLVYDYYDASTQEQNIYLHNIPRNSGEKSFYIFTF